MALQVWTGEHDISDTIQGDTHHNVKSIVQHSLFNKRAHWDYDFAILTIGCNEEIDLTDKARAACLPESGRLKFPNGYCQVPRSLIRLAGRLTQLAVVNIVKTSKVPGRCPWIQWMVNSNTFKKLKNSNC